MDKEGGKRPSESEGSSREESQLSSWTIDRDLILVLDDSYKELSSVKHDKVQFLHVNAESLKTAREILTLFVKINVNPNVFWITVKCTNSTEDPKAFFEFLCFNFLKEKTNELCLQVINNAEMSFQRRTQRFVKKKRSLYSEFIKKKFNYNIFLEILRTLNLSLIDVNFEDIFKYLKVKSESAKLELLSFEEDEILKKLIKFFVPESDIQLMKNKTKSVQLSDESLCKIVNKCRVNSSTYKLPRDELEELIKKVCNSEEMILMAETVAAYENLIFDFNCKLELIESLDFLYGLSGYGDDLIYVPINCESKEEKIKKFTFELTRCAMQIVYENNTLPYFEHQKKKEKVFRKFFNIKNKMKPSSSKVKVEAPSKNLQLCELIPDFFTSKISLKTLPSKDKNIFEFFKVFIKPDLAIEDGNEILELNRKFCLLNHLKYSELKLLKNIELKNQIQLLILPKKIFIKSNVPSLVLQRLFEQARDLPGCFNAENLFVYLKLINFSKIRKKFFKIAKSESIKTIFVDATDCNEENVDILMSAKPNAQLIVVGTDEKLFSDFEVQTLNFSWSDFSEETKKLLLAKTIKFQHQQVEFGDIFKSNRDDLPPEIFQDLCSNHQLVINSPDFDDTFESIPRTFKIKDKSQNAFFNLNSFATAQRQHFYLTENFSQQDLLKKVKNKSMILIADDPKSGKTTALREIENKLLKDEKFVIFLQWDDLVKYGEGHNFEEAITYIIKWHKNVTGGITFNNMFRNGDAIIILDGVNDTVDSEILFKMLQNFKNSGNQLWIGSSEVIGDKIEDKFDPVRIKLAEITEEEEMKFLRSSKISSLTNACGELIDKRPSSIKLSLLKFYALKSYLNINEREIFGLTNNKPLDPINNNEILRVNSETGFIQFKSPCLLHYLVADFIKYTFESFTRNYQYSINFFDFFLSILTNENCKNVRKMLNEMEISQLNVDESCRNLFRDALLRHYTEKNFELQLNEGFNLLTFVLRLINQADWNIVHDFLASTVSVLLTSIAPYIKDYPNDNIISFISKIPEDNLNEVMKSAAEYDNLRIFELIAKWSTNEKDVEFIIELYKSHNLDFKELINDLNIENCVYKIAIEQKNEALLKLLLKNENLSFDKWKKAMKIAFKIENWTLFNLIKQRQVLKTVWGKSDTVDRILIGYNQKINEIEKFHDDIGSENIDGITEFIKNNPNLKICALNGVVPLEHACNKEKYLSFKTLYENYFAWDIPKGKTYDDFMSRFLFKLKSDSVRTEAYYKGLLKNKLRKSASSKFIKFDEKIIDDLFELEDVKEVLMTVATTDVSIILVLDHDNLGKFDKKMDEFCDGVFYPKQKMMLVSQCKNEQTRYGVFAHEATHAAMQYVYGNNCKPYCRNDTTRKNEYSKLVEDFKNLYSNKRIDEEIISHVFSGKYEPDRFETELIVRVPHILAYYQGIRSENSVPTIDSPDVKLLKAKHPKFFEFYRDKTLKDLRVVDGVPLRALNDKFGLWDKIGSLPVKFNEHKFLKRIIFNDKNAILSAKHPELLLKSIFDILTNDKNYSVADEPSFFRVKASNLFVDVQRLLTAIKTDEYIINDLIENSMSETVKRIILYCDKNGTDSQEGLQTKQKRFKSLCEKIQNGLKTKKQILINPSNHFRPFVADLLPFDFTFSWFNSNVQNVINLTDKSRVDLSHERIKFQNTETPKISDILPLDSPLNEEVLNFLIKNDEINLNCFIPTNTAFYARKLLKKADSSAQETQGRSLVTLSRLISDVVAQQVKDVSKKLVLISDKHGSGKTEVLRNIYEFKMRKIRKDFWISFVSLEDHEEVLKNFDSASSEKTLHELLNIKSPFEEFAFKQFYDSRKVILLLDAIDHISSEARKNLISLINDPKLHQVWLTCQPNIEQSLNALNIAQVYSIKPLGLVEKINSLSFNEKVGYVKLKKFNISESNFENLELLEESTKVGFPLLVLMTAEYFTKNPNHSRALNFWDVCEIFYQHFYQKWRSLKKFNDYRMNFEAVHTFHAFAPFSNEDEIFEYSREDDWSVDELKDCGLLDGNHFKYKIIPQFLIASYIKRKLLKVWRYVEYPVILCNILMSESNKEILIMLDDILENFDKSIIPPCNLKLHNYLTQDENVSKILVKPFAEGHFNICLYLLEIIQKIDEKEKFYEHLRNNFENCKRLALKKVNDDNEVKYDEIKAVVGIN